MRPNIPERKTISHDVFAAPNRPTIVFVTVCTRDRLRWLAASDVHQRLVEVWRDARAWYVGRYVLMPDHMHFFVAPGEMELPLENWVTFWKSQFTRAHGVPGLRFQAGCWDTRLRDQESYDDKWEYVRCNPVRHGLVTTPDAWPFQGELNVLPW